MNIREAIRLAVYQTPPNRREKLTDLSRRRIATIARRPASTLGLVAIFLAFAFGLLVQQNRWYSTPAYGNLLIIFSAQTWGIIYLAAAVGMLLSALLRTQRAISLIAHTYAFMLLVSWEAAFIVRYLTDPKTTIANVVAWAAYVALVLRSATLIDVNLAVLAAHRRSASTDE